jgi:autophagy-related protein 9
MSNSTFVTGNHLGSLWLIEANNQNNHPYLLDWYYTSGPRHATSRYVPTDPFEETRHHSTDWMPSNLTRNEPEYEEYINEYHDDRAASQLGASTSAPIFRESIIQDQDSNDNLHHPTRSHWWARSHHQQGDGHDRTSFFEPPNFNHEIAYNNYNDKLSDIGSENHEQEQELYWRESDYHRSSHTVHIDDLESGELNLHFDDIYSRHSPENSTVNPNTRIFE